PVNIGSEIVSIRTSVGIVQSFVPPSSPLTIALDDVVTAIGDSALPTSTTISDISASYWDNPLLWFGTVILNVLLGSGKDISELAKNAGVSGFGGIGAKIVRLLPPFLLKPSSTKKIPFSYDTLLLTTNALIIRGSFKAEVERSP